MTKKKKIIWIIGNVFWGVIGFVAFLWGLFQSWGNNTLFWFYPIATVTIVLIAFATFNTYIISSANNKIKYWIMSFVILLVSLGGTILVHAILQNTIF